MLIALLEDSVEVMKVGDISQPRVVLLAVMISQI